MPILAQEAQSHVARGGHGARLNRGQQGNELQRMHFLLAIPVKACLYLSVCKYHQLSNLRVYCARKQGTIPA